MDETGWTFELRFMGARGVHPEKGYSISRSDDMLGDGGCVLVLRMGSDEIVEVPYSDMSRLSLREISFAGTPVVRVRRALGGNIVGEWLKVAAKHAPPVQASAQTRRPVAIRIDSTFGGTGAVFGDFKDPAAEARALIVEPDGHVIVAGTIGKADDPDGRNVGLIRFDANGRSDPHFGRNGQKVLDLEGVDNVVRAMARQADGKIVVAGEIVDPRRGTYDFALVRLDARGLLDSEFNGGFVTTSFFRNRDERVYAVAVQADGKIVAGGGFVSDFIPDDADDRLGEPNAAPDVEEFGFARYNPDGKLDATFGTDGLGMPGMTSGYGACARARALHIQADGLILVGGFATNSHDTRVREVAIARLNTDGTLDRAFGDRGRVFLSSGGVDEGAHALAVQSDGKIVVAGTTARDSASDQHFLLARLHPDGALDRTFGGTGIVVNRDFVGLTRAVIVLPDGRIVAAGSAAVTVVAQHGERVTREQVALVCHMPDGSLDDTFGTSGVLFIDLGGTDDSGAGMVLHGDKIFVAATSRTTAKSEFAVIRLAIG